MKVVKLIAVVIAGALSTAAVATETYFGQMDALQKQDVSDSWDDLGFDEPSDEVTDKVDRFGLACIWFGTDLPINQINFKLKLGNGSWVDHVIYNNDRPFAAPYQYPTPGNTSSPTLYIRFDSDFGNGDSWVEYKLEKYSAPEADCNRFGKDYRFQRDNGSNRYIDLVTGRR